MVTLCLSHQSPQCVQDLQEEYESQLQAKHNINTLQLLMTNAPGTLGSAVTPLPIFSDDHGNGQIAAQSCCNGPGKAQGCDHELVEVLTLNSVSRPSGCENGAHIEDETDEADICTGAANTSRFPTLKAAFTSSLSHRLWSGHRGLALLGDHGWIGCKR